MDAVTTYLAGLPQFFAYFFSALALTFLYAFIYSKLTPHKEWALIKDNVPAAAIAFSGSMLGFVIALASAMANSINLVDCWLWGMVALIVQLGTFFSVRLFMPRISERLENNELAAGIWLAAASLCAGILNAASLTY
ncbi:MAG: DUF350 domain-containing protein [Gammaproteobacteria bacterium]|nr:DUF350 domain-containing protein [Gammaproteobacteria bacterium]